MLCSQGKFVINFHLGRLIGQIWQHVDQVPLYLLAISRCGLLYKYIFNTFPLQLIHPNTTQIVMKCES